MKASAKILWSVALLALGSHGVAWSQPRLDPTRPATAWLKVQPTNPDSAANVEPILQLWLLGSSRKYAIINGHLVSPGSSYDGYRLVAIQPDKVVLSNDGRSRTLSMHPAVKKTVITPDSYGKTGKPKKNVVIGEKSK